MHGFDSHGALCHIFTDMFEPVYHVHRTSMLISYPCVALAESGSALSLPVTKEPFPQFVELRKSQPKPVAIQGPRVQMHIGRRKSNGASYSFIFARSLDAIGCHWCHWFSSFSLLFENRESATDSRMGFWEADKALKRRPFGQFVCCGTAPVRRCCLFHPLPSSSHFSLDIGIFLPLNYSPSIWSLPCVAKSSISSILFGKCIVQGQHQSIDIDVALLWSDDSCSSSALGWWKFHMW